MIRTEADGPTFSIHAGCEGRPDECPLCGSKNFICHGQRIQQVMNFPLCSPSNSVRRSLCFVASALYAEINKLICLIPKISIRSISEGNSRFAYRLTSTALSSERMPCHNSNAQISDPKGSTAPTIKRKTFNARPTGVRATTIIRIFPAQ